jgi:hypothetical protein
LHCGTRRALFVDVVFRVLLFFLAFVALSVVSPAAQAQSIAVGKTLVRRDDRPPGLPPSTINYDDCVADDFIRVPLTFSGATGYVLQVWIGKAGANCADPSAQALYNGTQCWQIFSSLNPASPVQLRVQSIIPHDNSSEGTDNGTAAACEAASTDSLTLYFLLLNGSTVVGQGATLAVKYDLQGPPAPTGVSVGVGQGELYPSWTVSNGNDVLGYYIYCEPSGANASSGNDTSSTGGTSSSGGSDGDTSATSSPLTDGGDTATQGGASAGGTSSGVTGGGVSDVGVAGGGTTGVGVTDGGTNGVGATNGGTDGGTVGGTSAGTGATGTGASTNGEAGDTSAAGQGNEASGNCTAPNLVAGERPPIGLRKGITSKTATSGNASNLDNYQEYACGVAAYDTLGNVGPISALACATPVQVVGYYDAYRASGGKAGGGYCAYGRGRFTPAWVALIWAGLGLFARRRMVRRARADETRR